ncbi:hypothetical protein BB559_006244 [Furculomyces boomerangus]|uniref:TNase-like domain-containing protein n=1 Tax=Furculomyces boomerangus TaxID=61424 RepID=A0A2T9Y406_9FUNG|nr:hypothetical protein BB559_006244 [Furculomyces boomerangus]
MDDNHNKNILVGVLSGLSLVVSVADGDTFRLFHMPTLRPKWLINKELVQLQLKKQFFANLIKDSKPGKKYKLSDRTINVRLYGVDSPEMGHFGNEKQRMSEEAKDYMTSIIMGRNVTILPLKKDIYDRVVSVVYYKRYIFNIDLSAEMVKRGFAQVYYGGDALYFGNQKKLEKLQSEAKNKKLGIWSLDNYVSPMEYKKNLRQNTKN